MARNMKKEFEFYLNGAETQVTLEQKGDIWVCESSSASCIAVDPRTALVGALGYGIGGEVWNSHMNNEGGE